MYVCLCFGVRKKIIEEILASQANLKLRDLQKICKAGQGCGTCLADLKLILSSHQNSSSSNSDQENPDTKCKILP